MKTLTGLLAAALLAGAANAATVAVSVAEYQALSASWDPTTVFTDITSSTSALVQASAGDKGKFMIVATFDSAMTTFTMNSVTPTNCACASLVMSSDNIKAAVTCSVDGTSSSPSVSIATNDESPSLTNSDSGGFTYVPTAALAWSTAPTAGQRTGTVTLTASGPITGVAAGDFAVASGITLSGFSAVSAYQYSIDVAFDTLGTDTLTVASGNVVPALAADATMTVAVPGVMAVWPTSTSVAYTEGGSAAALFGSDFALVEGDTTTLTSITLSWTNCHGDDVLAGLSTMSLGSISGPTAGACSVVITAGGATLAQATTDMKALTFASGEDPGDALNSNEAVSRVFKMEIIDGTRTTSSGPEADTAAVDLTITVAITEVNDAPTWTATNTPLAAVQIEQYTSNEIALVDSGFNIADVDDTQLSSVTVTIGSIQTGDSIAFVSGYAGSLSGSWSSPTFTMSGAAAIADYVTAIKALRMVNSDVAAARAARTVTIAITDAGAGSPSNASPEAVVSSPSVTVTLYNAPKTTFSADTGNSITVSTDFGGYTIDGTSIADGDWSITWNGGTSINILSSDVTCSSGVCSFSTNTEGWVGATLQVTVAADGVSTSAHPSGSEITLPTPSALVASHTIAGADEVDVSTITLVQVDGTTARADTDYDFWVHITFSVPVNGLATSTVAGTGCTVSGNFLDGPGGTDLGATLTVATDSVYLAVTMDHGSDSCGVAKAATTSGPEPTHTATGSVTESYRASASAIAIYEFDDTTMTTAIDAGNADLAVADAANDLGKFLVKVTFPKGVVGAGGALYAGGAGSCSGTGLTAATTGYTVWVYTCTVTGATSTITVGTGTGVGTDDAASTPDVVGDAQTSGFTYKPGVVVHIVDVDTDLGTTLSGHFAGTSSASTLSSVRNVVALAHATGPVTNMLANVLAVGQTGGVDQANLQTGTWSVDASNSVWGLSVTLYQRDVTISLSGFTSSERTDGADATLVHASAGDATASTVFEPTVDTVAVTHGVSGSGVAGSAGSYTTTNAEFKLEYTVSTTLPDMEHFIVIKDASASTVTEVDSSFADGDDLRVSAAWSTVDDTTFTISYERLLLEEVDILPATVTNGAGKELAEITYYPIDPSTPLTLQVASTGATFVTQNVRYTPSVSVAVYADDSDSVDADTLQSNSPIALGTTSAVHNMRAVKIALTFSGPMRDMDAGVTYTATGVTDPGSKTFTKSTDETVHLFELTMDGQSTVVAFALQDALSNVWPATTASTTIQYKPTVTGLRMLDSSGSVMGATINDGKVTYEVTFSDEIPGGIVAASSMFAEVTGGSSETIGAKDSESENVRFVETAGVTNVGAVYQFDFDRMLLASMDFTLGSGSPVELTHALPDASTGTLDFDPDTFTMQQTVVYVPQLTLTSEVSSTDQAGTAVRSDTTIVVKLTSTGPLAQVLTASDFGLESLVGSFEVQNDYATDDYTGTAGANMVYSVHTVGVIMDGADAVVRVLANAVSPPAAADATLTIWQSHPVIHMDGSGSPTTTFDVTWNEAAQPGSSVAILTSLALFDADYNGAGVEQGTSDQVMQAVVTIGTCLTDDRLSLPSPSGVVASYSSCALTITSSTPGAPVSVSVMEAALKTVEYNYISNEPRGAMPAYARVDRTVTVEVTDDEVDGSSNPLTSSGTNALDSDAAKECTVDVVADNDAPYADAALTGHVVTFTEDAGPVSVAPASGTLLHDDDDTLLYQVVISISRGADTVDHDATHDSLTFATGDIPGGIDATQTDAYTVTLVASDPAGAAIATFETAIRAVKFDNDDSAHPLPTMRTLIFAVTDAGDGADVPSACNAGGSTCIREATTITNKVRLVQVNDDPAVAVSGTVPTPMGCTFEAGSPDADWAFVMQGGMSLVLTDGDSNDAYTDLSDGAPDTETDRVKELTIYVDSGYLADQPGWDKFRIYNLTDASVAGGPHYYSSVSSDATKPYNGKPALTLSAAAVTGAPKSVMESFINAVEFMHDSGSANGHIGPRTFQIYYEDADDSFDDQDPADGAFPTPAGRSTLTAELTTPIAVTVLPMNDAPQFDVSSDGAGAAATVREINTATNPNVAALLAAQPDLATSARTRFGIPENPRAEQKVVLLDADGITLTDTVATLMASDPDDQGTFADDHSVSWAVDDAGYGWFFPSTPYPDKKDRQYFYAVNDAGTGRNPTFEFEDPLVAELSVKGVDALTADDDTPEDEEAATVNLNHEDTPYIMVRVRVCDRDMYDSGISMYNHQDLTHADSVVEADWVADGNNGPAGTAYRYTGASASGSFAARCTDARVMIYVVDRNDRPDVIISALENPVSSVPFYAPVGSVDVDPTQADGRDGDRHDWAYVGSEPRTGNTQPMDSADVVVMRRNGAGELSGNVVLGDVSNSAKYTDKDWIIGELTGTSHGFTDDADGFDESAAVQDINTYTYRKRDMLHGQFNNIPLDFDQILDDEDIDPSQDNDIHLTYLGYRTFDGSSWSATWASDPVLINGTTVPFNLDGMFDENDFEFVRVGTEYTAHVQEWELRGTPTYDNTFELREDNYAAYVSPKKRVLVFMVTVTDDNRWDSSLDNRRLQSTWVDDDAGISQRVLNFRFEVDVEIPGCANPLAKWEECAHADLTVDDRYNDTLLRDYAHVCSNIGGSPAANPFGNYNPWVTIPTRACVFPPQAVDGTTGATLNVVGVESVDDADTAIAALGGATPDPEDYAGAMKVTIPASDSLTGIGVSVEENQNPDEVPKPRPGDYIKADNVLKAGPAGLEFDQPAEVVMFIGTTDCANTYHVLYTASELDPARPELGYGPWESTFDNNFDCATGRLSGQIKHFSLIAAVQKPIPVATVNPKHRGMGGGCPNECSAHGYCRAHGQCSCFELWGGYDCSQRECPVAPAWGANAAVSKAVAECAGVGVCNRERGECQCPAGYEGAACQRTTCPQDCSGHGVCRTLDELSEVTPGYGDWDRARIQRCVCDAGYTGVDCTQRICPRGDNPDTDCLTQNPQVQRILLSKPSDSIGSGLPSTASVRFDFNGADGEQFSAVMSDPSDGTNGMNSLREALYKLPRYAAGIEAVSVSSGTITTTSIEYFVTFHGSRVRGNQTLLSCPAQSMCMDQGCAPQYNTVVYQEENVHAASLVLNEESSMLQSSGGLTAGVEIDCNAAGTAWRFREIDGEGAPYQFIDFSAIPWSEWRPWPRGAGRIAVPIGSKGLALDFDPGSVGTCGQDGVQRIFWTVPTCSITTSSPADTQYENAVCSDRGLCDHGTGECKCMPGYGGPACESKITFQ